MLLYFYYRNAYCFFFDCAVMRDDDGTPESLSDDEDSFSASLSENDSGACTAATGVTNGSGTLDVLGVSIEGLIETGVIVRFS